MATDYYHQIGDGKKRHIGRSAAGWVFMLHIYPEDGIQTLEDWKDFWTAGSITDEYLGTIHPDEMLEIITDRASPVSWDEFRPHQFSGYKNEVDFHRTNLSIRGPNGLLRSEISYRSDCVGHGEGTWDYFVTDFS